MKNVYDIFKERGFIEQVTDEENLRKLLSEPQIIYCGFDPTADSLHLGSMVPLLGLMHLQRNGHHVIALLGGATGMIGDPSGRDSERNFLDEGILEANLEAQRQQIARFINFSDNSEYPAALAVNNAEWTKEYSLIDWLRGVGKKFTINYMVAKESVRKRFEDRDQGISYTEFSYMLIQANDFYHLAKENDCFIQVGGGDQWGNITAGIELIRREMSKQAYGITFPLLTSATGQKFGKSLGGALYLDANRTSPWDFYQYLVRTDDRDVVWMLKMFTFMPMDDIAQLEEEVKNNPENRKAQKRLAWEVTALVHGGEEADRMQKGAEALYAGQLEKLDADLISQVFSDGPVAEIEGEKLENGSSLLEVSVETGLVSSKGEAKRMFKQGAMYVNDKRVQEDYMLSGNDVLEASSSIILRKGKKSYLVVRVRQ